MAAALSRSLPDTHRGMIQEFANDRNLPPARDFLCKARTPEDGGLFLAAAFAYLPQPVLTLAGITGAAFPSGEDT